MDMRLAGLGALFPSRLRGAVEGLLEEKGEVLEELRLRAGVPMTWTVRGRELPLRGSEVELRPTPGELEEIVRRASGRAVYAVEASLRRGFLPLPLGHRLGLVGETDREDGGIRSFRSYQALNLRLARERPGAADRVASRLWAEPGSTLILGPPGSGKTTLLRDLVRQCSDRFGQRVGLVDERGELAACAAGLPQLRVGDHTDVLTGCPKAQGIDLLVRVMAPDWVALDEITDPADAEALIRGACCGVRFLATAHGSGREDLDRRPVYRQVREAGVFENLVVLRPDRSLYWERMEHGTDSNCRDLHDPGLLSLDRAPRRPADPADPEGTGGAAGGSGAHV